jgi:hypothetical protein
LVEAVQSVRVYATPCHLVIAHRDDDRVVAFDLDAAAFPLCLHVDDGDDVIASVDELLRLEAVRTPVASLGPRWTMSYPGGYPGGVALSDEQLKRVEDNRRGLKERSPDANRRIAAWLREIAPKLDDRKAPVAGRMAGDFEALAREVEPSRSPQP